MHILRAVGDNDGMRWVALLAVLAGCFESQLRYCENGAICPETLACTERTPTVCGEPDDVAACQTQADRTACTSERTPLGTCTSGVCGPCVPELVECRYPAWTPMQSPTGEVLRSLWVVADNDVYAAGQAVIIHYDGTAWSTLAYPMTGFAINAIWASAAGDIVAVAQDGDVFRWSSGAWTLITPTPKTALRGIWGTAIGDLFVVGVTGTIQRYDGTAWTPMMANTTSTLGAIWGTSAMNLVAAGNSGTIQRYNGSNWQAAPGTPITGVTFRGVWTTGSQIFAVGATTAGLIATQQSAGWNTQMVSTPYLAGVWGSADDDVYAVGDAGMIMHYDGATWAPMTSTTQSSLEAVAGTATNVFAVGAAGTILRYSPP
jgi:hypothetical protein